MRALVQRALLVLGLISMLTGAAHADAEPSNEPEVAPGSEAPAEPSSREVGLPVRLDGEEVFRLQGGHVESFSPRDRVANAEAALLQVAQDPFYADGLLTVERREHGAEILYRDERVGVVSDAYARSLGVSAEEKAAELIDAVEVAVASYRERREPEAWTRALFLLLLATAVLALALWLIHAAHRKLADWLEDRRRAGLNLGGQRLGFRTTARFAAFVRRGLGLGRSLAVVMVVLVYLQFDFAVLPMTRAYALGVIEYLLDPLRVVWSGVLRHVGDLFFIVVIVVLTRMILRGILLLFTEASRGTLSLPGIPADRAIALYKIVRFVLIAISIVMIYPYIPGSSSAAFQGISLIAGALFTLGATSTASNFIGGTLLVFSGAFRVGDRIQVGDVRGDVEESTLALTRIRTSKNELVTFSNAAVLNEGFINYSTLAREDGLILHTTISIGYEVPWRRVHELLVQAGLGTDGVLEEPAPFVIQTALNDHHVSYEINVHTQQANSMLRILGELHQNIQDAFNASGIEILSPVYAAHRDGAASTVPEPDVGSRPPAATSGSPSSAG